MGIQIIYYIISTNLFIYGTPILGKGNLTTPFQTCRNPFPERNPIPEFVHLNIAPPRPRQTLKMVPFLVARPTQMPPRPPPPPLLPPPPTPPPFPHFNPSGSGCQGYGIEKNRNLLYMYLRSTSFVQKSFNDLFTVSYGLAQTTLSANYRSRVYTNGGF